MRELGARRFLYLIQEYEPFTFPMGTWAALAEESYRFDHAALFSTELLRDFFRAAGHRGYGERRLDPRSRTRSPPVAAPAADELAAPGDRGGCSSTPAPRTTPQRNMFELGVLALDRALARGAFRGWELHGIGTVEAGPAGLGGRRRLAGHAAARRRRTTTRGCCATTTSGWR